MKRIKASNVQNAIEISKRSQENEPSKTDHVAKIFKLIDELERHPGLAYIEYATNCGFDDATTSRMLNKLLRLNKVRRAAGSNDRGKTIWKWYLKTKDDSK